MEATRLLTSNYERDSEALSAALPQAAYRRIYAFYVLAKQADADASYLAGSDAESNFRTLQSALADAIRALHPHVS